MLSPCVGTTYALLNQQSAAQLLRALNNGTPMILARATLFTTSTQLRPLRQPTRHQAFHSSPATRIKEFFPVKETDQIRITPPAWHHPIYTEDQMNQVVIAHREAKTLSDKLALQLVRLLRWGMDRASGYVHKDAVELAKIQPEAARRKYMMTERKYMIRNVFLESVAGVPGMVAGMLRHLRSMRRMKRDNGWMETLLEESYNERMHLLTFLKLCEPGWFMRLMVLGTQGVFFNAFFLAYLAMPRACHRFVGYLEEEAVTTYTRQIEDLDAGRLPMWEKMQAPDIAVQYWNMPEGKRTMRDLLLYIRADESKHREVNHTFGNLDQRNDPNPYVSQYKEGNNLPHPVKDIQHQRPLGWEREDVI